MADIAGRKLSLGLGTVLTLCGSQISEQAATLLPLPAIFRDVHNLVFKNEKIGSAFARQPHHMFVVIFDPAADGLTIHQLYANRFLLLPQSLEEIGLFESLFRGRGPAALSSVRISLRAERHSGIVHGRAAPKNKATALKSDDC